MSLREAAEDAANVLDSLSNATCLGRGTRDTMAKTAEQLRFSLSAPDEMTCIVRLRSAAEAVVAHAGMRFMPIYLLQDIRDALASCPEAQGEEMSLRTAADGMGDEPMDKDAVITTFANWHPGGAQGVYPEFYDGDRIIVAVAVRNSRLDPKGKFHWEYYCIVATCDSETPLSWNTTDGDSWSAWDWSDVDWWMYAKFDLPFMETQCERSLH